MLLDAYPYLIFDGEAQEAFDFYAEVLNAENLGLTKFKDMPAVPDSQPLSDEAQNLVMNATLQLPNGSYLMFSDTFPGMPYSKGNNVSITLVYDTLEETKKRKQHLINWQRVEKFKWNFKKLSGALYTGI